MESGCIHPRILDLYINWSWMATSSPSSFYPQGKYRYPLDRRLGGPQRLDDVERRKILHLLELELRTLSNPTRSQSLYRLRYPGSPNWLCRLYKNMYMGPKWFSRIFSLDVVPLFVQHASGNLRDAGYEVSVISRSVKLDIIFGCDSSHTIQTTVLRRENKSLFSQNSDIRSPHTHGI
jgi:hypothetical protein